MLYLIAILEGFSTLAVQIIALRAATPLVGSSIVMTSIYIGIILLALSIGYYGGGIIAEKFSREKIIWWLFGSLTVSGIYYLVLTFGAHTYLLESFLSSTGSYVWTLFVVAFVLFFIPVILASQTIPLLTELLPISSKGKSTGVMLFASTVGSFLGSVGTSIVLFPMFGVVTSSILTAAIVLLAAGLTLSLVNKHKATIYCTLVICCTLFYLLLFHNLTGEHIYKFDSAYQEIIIKKVTVDNEDAKLFMINGSFASAVIDIAKKSPFSYIREAVEITQKIEPRRVLVLGSAGFTYPVEIASLGSVQRIDTVDIDPSLQHIAEKYFWEEPLPEKVTVYAQPARYFLNQAIKNNDTYDVVFVDAYNGKAVPEQLLTVEFFQDLKKVAPKGIILMNVIADRDLESRFIQRVSATFQAGLQQKGFVKDVTLSPDSYVGNLIFSSEKWDENYQELKVQGPVYTDNSRSAEKDHFALRRKGLY